MAIGYSGKTLEDKLGVKAGHLKTGLRKNNYQQHKVNVIASQRRHKWLHLLKTLCGITVVVTQ